MKRDTIGLLSLCLVLSGLLGWTYLSYHPDREGYLVENQAIFMVRNSGIPYDNYITINHINPEHPSFLWMALTFHSPVTLSGHVWDTTAHEQIIPSFASNKTVVFEIWVHQPSRLIFSSIFIAQLNESISVRCILQWQTSSRITLYDHIPDMDNGNATVYQGEVPS